MSGSILLKTLLIFQEFPESKCLSNILHAPSSHAKNSFPVLLSKNAFQIPSLLLKNWN